MPNIQCLLSTRLIRVNKIQMIIHRLTFIDVAMLFVVLTLLVVKLSAAGSLVIP